MQTRESLQQQFETRCRALGLAVTHQRTVIYGELIATGEHPTPEAVYERVKAQIPAISLGTVYKNVKTFLDAGLLKEVSLHHGTLRLDANTEPHHHMVCTRCRRIFDIPETEFGPVHLKNLPESGFQIDRFSIEVVGVCGACAAARPESSGPGASAADNKRVL
ncbi:MAG: transcriptional repressor [Acidobacteria bacterium]|nr:transcriptional repressor [Acidobacteriota bacterium]